MELDESYSGGIRKGKRGRENAGKVAVSGILKRGVNVYTQTILNAKTAYSDAHYSAENSALFLFILMAIARITVSGFKRYRINHSTLFAHGRHHINGIEDFWNQFLKECEWRFNTGSPQKLLKDLKSALKSQSQASAPK